MNLTSHRFIQNHFHAFAAYNDGPIELMLSSLTFQGSPALMKLVAGYNIMPCTRSHIVQDQTHCLPGKKEGFLSLFATVRDAVSFQQYITAHFKTENEMVSSPLYIDNHVCKFLGATCTPHQPPPPPIYLFTWCDVMMMIMMMIKMYFISTEIPCPLPHSLPLGITRWRRILHIFQPLRSYSVINIPHTFIVTYCWLVQLCVVQTANKKKAAKEFIWIYSAWSEWCAYSCQIQFWTKGHCEANLMAMAIATQLAFKLV